MNSGDSSSVSSFFLNLLTPIIDLAYRYNSNQSAGQLKAMYTPSSGRPVHSGNKWTCQACIQPHCYFSVAAMTAVVAAHVIAVPACRWRSIDRDWCYRPFSRLARWFIQHTLALDLVFAIVFGCFSSITKIMN